MRKPPAECHRSFRCYTAHLPHAGCFLLLFLLLAGAGISTAWGQDILETIGDDVTIVLTDAVEFASAPLHLGADEWAVGGLGIGLVAAAATQDRDVRSLALRNPTSGTIASIFSAGRNYGSIINLQILSSAVYVTGLMFDDNDVRRTGRMMTESILLAGVTRMVLGVATGRHRPFDGRGPWSFRPLGWNDIRQSMPSGHAAFAAAVSTVLAEEIGHPVATGILFSLAAVTSISRITDDQHWLSDVVAGSAIGILAGEYVVSRERSRSRGAAGSGSGFRVMPGIGGMTLNYVF